MRRLRQALLWQVVDFCYWAEHHLPPRHWWLARRYQAERWHNPDAFNWWARPFWAKRRARLPRGARVLDMAITRHGILEHCTVLAPHARWLALGDRIEIEAFQLVARGIIQSYGVRPRPGDRRTGEQEISIYCDY